MPRILLFMPCERTVVPFGGIPVAATGLIYPIRAMVAMAVSATAVFINSLWDCPRLFSIRGFLSFRLRRC
jgi:hypothetical protein